jgi:hypothetical protein
MSPYSNPSAYEDNAVEEAVPSINDTDLMNTVEVRYIPENQESKEAWIRYLIQNEILPWAVQNNDTDLLEDFESYMPKNQDSTEISGDSDI